MVETRATCCYCGVGCGLIIEHDGRRIHGVRGDPDHPANRGMLCSKGASLHLTATQQGRALYPQLRRNRAEPRARVGWDTALDTAAATFGRIIATHGPDAVAFYVSGQFLTEDYYVFNKLAKGLIGTNNLDSNSRLCMSSAVAGYKQTLGADAQPACYEDIDQADCVLVWGANPAFAHPVLFRRLEQAKARNPALRLIVIDPRRTDTAHAADLHLPILPGTDLVLLNAMLNVLLWEGLVDWEFVRAHTEGFDALRDAVREMTPVSASQICGLPADAIVTAARWFGRAKAALSLWCQGLNQSTHGTYNSAALIHLHLATGQIGRPGAGPLSLTGQPNAMGGREVGAMANLLSAHRDLADAADRAAVARFWGVESVPARPGRSALEMFDALRAGEIKAVWIACTNPAQSMPQQGRIREALTNAEFVVVQEAFETTETAAFADLLLPAATWGEKEGTVTNSERRVTHVRKAIEPPGEARPDWRIGCDFALRLGARLGKVAAALFPYDTPEEVFAEHAASTRGRDLEISGLSYAVLDRDGPQQWPYRAGSATPRLYGNARFATPGGRARFVAIEPRTVAEPTDARYPLKLSTGRLRDQWHGMSRTRRAARLFGHAPEPAAAMHADDMARRGLRSGDLAWLESRRGRIVLKVEASAEMYPGQVFAPMHFGACHLSHAGINELTIAALDPYSKQPELKHAAIQVDKAVLPWNLLAVRAAAPGAAEQALAWLDRLQPLLAGFGYAYAGLLGHDRPAVALHVAHDEPISPERIAQIDACLDLPAQACASYTDARRNIAKQALLADGRLHGFRLCGDVAAADWLREILLEARPADALRRWMLGPFESPPVGAQARRRGRIVCNCIDVSQADIEAQLAAGASMEHIQLALRCGTSCGSCLPELRRMARSAQQAV
jgi:assimilatory nitrate reductase catalytic subunit